MNNKNNEKSEFTAFSQTFDPSTHIWGDCRIVMPSSNRVERSSGLDITVVDEHAMDIVDVDDVHLSLFGPEGEHKSISENSFTMNKNNKEVAYFEVGGISHGINPADVIRALSVEIVRTRAADIKAADFDEATRPFSDHDFAYGS